MRAALRTGRRAGSDLEVCPIFDGLRASPGVPLRASTHDAPFAHNRTPGLYERENEHRCLEHGKALQGDARASSAAARQSQVPHPRKLGRLSHPCVPAAPSSSSWRRAAHRSAATSHLAGGAVRLSSAAGREMGARAPRGRRRRRRRARAGAPADVHARKERRKAVPHWAPPCGHPPRRRALEGRGGGLGRPWPPPRPGRRRPGWARRRGCGRPRLRRSSGPGGRLRARRAVPLGLHAFPRKKIAVNRGVWWCE